MPHKFVLKGQLDDGKGNFFNEELADKLKKMSKEERGAYILQKRISPIAVKVGLSFIFICSQFLIC
jgi:hypothetical protein